MCASLLSEETLYAVETTAPCVSSVVRSIDLSLTKNPMFQALGFGILLLILQTMVPTVFTKLVGTTITVLDGVQTTFAVVSLLASAAASIPH